MKRQPQPRAGNGPVSEHHMLDIWLALGGNYPSWVRWRQEPRRSFADAWSQLLTAIAGDRSTLAADTNPPAGELLDLVMPQPGEVDSMQRWAIAKWLAGLIGEITGADLDAADCQADADDLIAHLGASVR